MKLKKYLSKEVVVLNLEATSKEGIISEMVDILYNAGKIKIKEPVLNAVLKREKQMSTGIQAGIAIPHGKCKDVTSLSACIAIAKDGKDFQSLDGEPSNIFIMTVSPANKTGPHVQFLAEISRMLTNADIRSEILNSTSAEEVLKIFLG